MNLFTRLEHSKDEEENSEPEAQLHPLVSVSNIDPEEIPAGPPNRFLSRGGPSAMFLMKPQVAQIDSDDKEKKRNRIRGVTKSGRIVKGRGTLRFRTPSRSRSRSYTPPHWRQEQNKMITFNEFEVSLYYYTYIHFKIIIILYYKFRKWRLNVKKKKKKLKDAKKLEKRGMKKEKDRRKVKMDKHHQEHHLRYKQLFLKVIMF